MARCLRIILCLTLFTNLKISASQSTPNLSTKAISFDLYDHANSIQHTVQASTMDVDLYAEEFPKANFPRAQHGMEANGIEKIKRHFLEMLDEAEEKLYGPEAPIRKTSALSPLNYFFSSKPNPEAETTRIIQLFYAFQDRIKEIRGNKIPDPALSQFCILSSLILHDATKPQGTFDYYGLVSSRTSIYLKELLKWIESSGKSARSCGFLEFFKNRELPIIYREFLENLLIYAAYIAGDSELKGLKSLTKGYFVDLTRELSTGEIYQSLKQDLKKEESPLKSRMIQFAVCHTWTKENSFERISLGKALQIACIQRQMNDIVQEISATQKENSRSGLVTEVPAEQLGIYLQSLSELLAEHPNTPLLIIRLNPDGEKVITSETWLHQQIRQLAQATGMYTGEYLKITNSYVGNNSHLQKLWYLFDTLFKEITQKNKRISYSETNPSIYE